MREIRGNAVRWAGWILLALAVLVVLVPLAFQSPWWVDGHQLRAVGVTGPNATAAERREAARAQHDALDKDRNALLKILAGAGAGVALVYTDRKHKLDRAAHALTEQGQVTDRYTKAIDQLGAPTLDIRLGGIYALERIARDSATDHPTVIEVLAAFVREHTTNTIAPTPSTQAHTPDRTRRTARMRARLPHPADPDTPIRPDADVHAALTVIGRRDSLRDRGRVHLTDANLTGADLIDAELGGAHMLGVNLTDAHMPGVNLTGAYLPRAYLTQANLTGADLTGAELTDAELTDANLIGTNLTGTNLAHANLTYANLTQANLTDANLTYANLIDAELGGAELIDARGLTAEQIAVARTDEHTRLPSYLTSPPLPPGPPARPTGSPPSSESAT